MGEKQNGKPSVLLSKVPRLSDICDALGFPNPQKAYAFGVFTHKLRKTYTTADRRPGTNLARWKDPKTQSD